MSAQWNERIPFFSRTLGDADVKASRLGGGRSRARLGKGMCTSRTSTPLVGLRTSPSPGSLRRNFGLSSAMPRICSLSFAFPPAGSYEMDRVGLGVCVSGYMDYWVMITKGMAKYADYWQSGSLGCGGMVLALGLILRSSAYMLATFLSELAGRQLSA